MRYLKAFIIGLLALVSVVFVIENIEALNAPVQFKLKLYVANLETASLPLWVLTILSFALGAILVLIYLVYDHIKQRQVIRQLRQNVEIMGLELKRAGVTVETTTAAASAPPESTSK
jgi:uncharacterized integral membrane protein